MLYLLDASVLITAHNEWYGQQRVPEFWSWLLHHGKLGNLRIPAEIYMEVEAGRDELARWMRMASTKQALLLDEDGNPASVQAVLSHYGTGMTETDLITIGQDPFLIAAAYRRHDRQVVTAEGSKPSRRGANRHIPDICADCGVVSLHPVTLIRLLDFSTGWNRAES